MPRPSAVALAGERENGKALARPRSAPLGRRRSASTIDRLPEHLYEMFMTMVEEPERYTYQDIIDVILIESAPGEPSWLRAGIRDRIEAGKAVYDAAKTDENLDRYVEARNAAHEWALAEMHAKAIAPLEGTSGPIKLSHSAIGRRYLSAVRAAREVERNADLWARTWKGADATQTLGMIHTASAMLQTTLIDFMAGGANVKQLNKINGLLKAAASYARAAVEVERATRENRRQYDACKHELASEVRRVLDEHPRERDHLLTVIDKAVDRLKAKPGSGGGAKR